MTHFELFGLPVSVDLDVATLEANYRAQSLETHPDRLKAAGAHDRRVAAEKSATLNEAFKVLKDPVRRAFYVLELRGVKMDTEDAAAKLKLPMEFLEEVMERREALEGVRAEKNLTAAQKMAEEIRALKDETLNAAQQALRTGETANATHALARLRYYTRFLEEVDAFEEELS